MVWNVKNACTCMHAMGHKMLTCIILILYMNQIFFFLNRVNEWKPLRIINFTILVYDYSYTIGRGIIVVGL